MDWRNNCDRLCRCRDFTSFFSPPRLMLNWLCSPRVMEQLDVFPLSEGSWAKIPLVQFDSYQWHVFCKFTSVQQKSSCKASWKRRKYFKRYVIFTSDSSPLWHQWSNLGTFLYHCYFHIQIEIRRNEGAAFSSGRLQLLRNSLLQNQESKSQKHFGGNSVVLKWFST